METKDMGTHCLFLRLIGPMQAWGAMNRLSFRDTDTYPTYSGVVGILASALGIARDDNDSLQPLLCLRMWMAAIPSTRNKLGDGRGRRARDYQTIQNVMTADGKLKKKEEAVLSERIYLSGARFLVGIEGEQEILTRLSHAIHYPHWHLFLGRKAFPLAAPLLVFDSPQEGLLEDFLEETGKREGYPGRREDPEKRWSWPERPESFSERRFSPIALKQTRFFLNERVRDAFLQTDIPH